MLPTSYKQNVLCDYWSLGELIVFWLAMLLYQISLVAEVVAHGVTCFTVLSCGSFRSAICLCFLAVQRHWTGRSCISFKISVIALMSVCIMHEYYINITLFAWLKYNPSVFQWCRAKRPWFSLYPTGHIGPHSDAIRVCEELPPLLPPRWTPSFVGLCWPRPSSSLLVDLVLSCILVPASTVLAVVCAGGPYGRHVQVSEVVFLSVCCPWFVVQFWTHNGVQEILANYRDCTA